ncbi:MAG: phosphoadenosine phosphosulfate reductase family protein [Promethearchaeota archaeon]
MYKIKCLKCGDSGYVTTRWIKGPSLKPIFILHIKNGEVKKTCELDQDQSNDIHGNVSVLESNVYNLLKNKKPYALFSGGKDGIATLIYLNQKAKKLNKDLMAIYIDTTVGLPENTKYVKSVCKYLDTNLTVVKPKKDYFTLVKEWGIPSFKYRWCCRELKIKPIEDYLKKVKEP